MAKITVRLHKELYEEILEEAKKEKRTKSGLLAKILEEQAEKFRVEEFEVKSWSGLFQADKSSGEKTHTIYPPIGVRVTENTSFCVENIAILNDSTIQDVVSGLVARHYWDKL